MNQESLAWERWECQETQVRSQVEQGNHGKIVAIALETGDFEIDASEIAACDRLEARRPDAQIWMVPIGSRQVRRFGGRTKRAVWDLFDPILLPKMSEGWVPLEETLPLSVRL